MMFLYLFFIFFYPLLIGKEYQYNTFLKDLVSSLQATCLGMFFTLVICSPGTWEFLINTGTLENFPRPISIHYKGPNTHEHFSESLGDVIRSYNTSSKCAKSSRMRFNGEQENCKKITMEKIEKTPMLQIFIHQELFLFGRIESEGRQYIWMFYAV